MLLSTHALQKVYFVNNHEDNRSYQFDSAEEAQEWRRELIKDFGMNDVSVLERVHNEFGDLISQRYI